MKEFIPVMKRAPIFGGIDEEEIESVLGCLKARICSYEKGEYALRAGDPMDEVGLVVAGSVLVVQEDFWGNRNLRAKISPGQTFGEAFACVPGMVADVSVTAGENSKIMWIGVRRILDTCPSACAHHSRMVRNLLSDLALKNIKNSEKLTHVCKRTTRTKLLSYLSSESQRQGKTEFDIPFDRQQLADYLSVERSAMSAELSRMQRDGLLEVHKNRFRLKDEAMYKV